MHLLRQQLLAEGAEEVRLHEHVESNFNQELAFHLVELAVAEHWEELRKAAVAHRLVLPHLVGKQQRRQEQGSPSAGVQGDVRALLEPTQVDHAHDESGHAEDALV
jgi:hypothetical protein